MEVKRKAESGKTNMHVKIVAEAVGKKKELEMGKQTHGCKMAGSGGYERVMMKGVKGGMLAEGQLHPRHELETAGIQEAAKTP